MTLLRLPTEAAQLHVRISLEVETVRRRLPVGRHPVSMLLALVGDLQDEAAPAVLRQVYIELAAVAQQAAGEIDREGGA